MHDHCYILIILTDRTYAVYESTLPWALDILRIRMWRSDLCLAKMRDRHSEIVCARFGVKQRKPWKKSSELRMWSLSSWVNNQQCAPGAWFEAWLPLTWIYEWGDRVIEPVCWFAASWSLHEGHGPCGVASPFTSWHFWSFCAPTVEALSIVRQIGFVSLWQTTEVRILVGFPHNLQESARQYVALGLHRLHPGSLLT